MAKINIDMLANEILKDLDIFQKATIEIVKNAVDRSAQMTVQDLKDTSPRRKTKGGKYAESWATKRDRNLNGRLKYSRVVYSQAPEYRLTHLLEKGHASRNGGRVGAKTHIEPAEQTAIKNLLLYIEEGIKNAGR